MSNIPDGAVKKTIRRQPWTKDETVMVHLVQTDAGIMTSTGRNKPQKSDGQRHLVYDEQGELLGHVVSTVTSLSTVHKRIRYDSLTRQFWCPGDGVSHTQWWSKHETQADAIRELLG